MKTNLLYYRPDGRKRQSFEVKNGNLYHDSRIWKRGRGITQRIDVIVSVTNLSLSDVARLSDSEVFTDGFDTITGNLGLIVSKSPTYRSNLCDTLAGRRNTPRYVRALENGWRLPIAELRRIYNEDKSRIEPFTHAEIREFRDWYRERSGLQLSAAEQQARNTARSMTGASA
jgi:hypothetical protein